jgi:hypothetical protein
MSAISNANKRDSVITKTKEEIFIVSYVATSFFYTGKSVEKRRIVLVIALIILKLAFYCNSLS